MSMPPGGFSPLAAVRADLRAALAELADELLEEVGTERLVDAVRHAWMLAYLAEVGEGPLRGALRSLLHDLRAGGPVDAPLYARQLILLSDQI